MLYRLEIENFYSVRDAQALDLTIAPNVTDDGNRFAPIFPGSDLRAPKVIALYGPNASGKTTVLKALWFLMTFARESFQRTIPGFALERFNDVESCSRPIRLAMEFGGIMDASEATMARARAGEKVSHGVYRYELTIEVVDGIATRVISEALRQKPDGKGKWQRVFERDGSNGVKGSTSFPIQGYRHLLNTLKPNHSVVSSFAQFRHPAATVFAEAAAKVFSNLGWEGAQPNDQAVVNFLSQQPDVVESLNRDLNRIDVGVSRMRIENGANGPVPMFMHEGLHVEMPWSLESHGTRAFIRMFPLLAMTLTNGGIGILDEFDVLIHPIVLPELLRWFYDGEDRNKLEAQVWLSCHSASLLDDLEKEEVAFCEKNSSGATSIYSLMDIKAVRRDDNLYRKYLSGAYGALPHIG